MNYSIIIQSNNRHSSGFISYKPNAPNSFGITESFKFFTFWFEAKLLPIFKMLISFFSSKKIEIK